MLIAWVGGRGTLKGSAGVSTSWKGELSATGLVPLLKRTGGESTLLCEAWPVGGWDISPGKSTAVSTDLT